MDGSGFDCGTHCLLNLLVYYVPGLFNRMIFWHLFYNTTLEIRIHYISYWQTFSPGGPAAGSGTLIAVARSDFQAGK